MPSNTFAVGETPVVSDKKTGPTINYGKVEQTWLDWNNGLRANLWLPAYRINSVLSSTATSWSQQAKQQKNITHKRSAKDWYYSYNNIVKRFNNRGISFKKINGITFSESIWYGYYSCNQDECTDELIKGIKSTFDMYMREKGKKWPHYKALVMKEFTVMGLGVVVDEKARKYYLTVHYGTEVVE